MLNPLLEKRVKRVYTIGAAAAKIESQVRGAEIVSAGTLDARGAARQRSRPSPGDIVLLAPACASFDQFDSYEHRGRVFKDLVEPTELRGMHERRRQAARAGGKRIMAKRVSVDKWLFTVTLLLVFIGLVMVFSASAVMAKERFGSPYGFLLRQMAWAGAGIAAMLVVMNIDYKQYRRPSVVFTFLGFTSLLLIAVFLLSRFAQHPSLDQVWRLLVPAVGTGEACNHPLSGIFPGIALAANHRLEARAGSRCGADVLLCAAHREGAGPGHRDRVHGDLRPPCLFVAGMNMKYLWYGLRPLRCCRCIS